MRRCGELRSRNALLWDAEGIVRLPATWWETERAIPVRAEEIVMKLPVAGNAPIPTPAPRILRGDRVTHPRTLRRWARSLESAGLQPRLALNTAA